MADEQSAGVFANVRSSRERTTEFVFVLTAFAVATLCLFSPALIPKNPISYLTTDYLTFYSVLQNPALFKDTALLDIAAETAKTSVLLGLLSMVSLPPVYLFLVSYFVQNFLLAYGLVKLAHAVRPGIAFSVAALLLIIILTDGVFFSIRTHLSFLALGVVFLCLSYVLRGEYFKAAVSAIVAGVIHPTQPLVLALIAVGNPLVDFRNKLRFILLPVVVMTLLVALNSGEHIGSTAPGYMTDARDLIVQLNDNYYPLAHPVLWAQVFFSLACAAALFYKKHQIEQQPQYGTLAYMLGAAAILQFGTLILESGLPLPSLLFQLAINFRLMQMMIAVLFICVAVMIYDGLDRNERWLYFGLGLLITFIFPHVLKAESPQNHLAFMQDTSFKYNVLLFALLVGLSRAYREQWAVGRALTGAALLLGTVLYFNYDNWLFIPFLGMLLANAANLEFGHPRLPQNIASPAILTLAVVSAFVFSLHELDWNIEYSRTFFTGARTLKTTVVRNDWEGGPVLVAPLREIELSPIYPVLVERLDTTYLVYFPELRARMLEILELYKSTPDERYESALRNADGWRGHIDELTTKYPSVKYVVTFEKYVCAGDKDVTSLYDRRMRKLAVIPIRTAARGCGRTT